MGFDDEQACALTLATFTGAARLAADSPEPASVLRERVTSKGGTTAAALAVMAGRGVDRHIVEALAAARARSEELGDELGRD
jgi:pyrroline-5-carboxylate reductase